MPGRALSLVGLAVLAGCASGGSGGAYPGFDPAAEAPAAGARPAGDAGAAAGAPAGAPETGLERWGDLPPAAPPPGVRVLTGSGEPSSWEALVEAAHEARVILLGELHDDVRGHRTRHALVRRLAWGGEVPPEAGCVPLVISLEMLETDVQLVVEEYQAGLITREHFLRAARPWDNHLRDYEPYLEVARGCDAPLVAANPPRRYVNRVARLGEAGVEGLAPEALATLPPLPVAPPSEAYRAEWRALMGGMGHGDGGGTGHGAAGGHGAGGDHGGAAPSDDPVLLAQNLWDAGMAWAVARAARAHPEARVVHVAGAFHVAQGTGIAEHLAEYLPGVKPLLVVAYPVAPGASFDPERHTGAGDFVLLVDR